MSPSWNERLILGVRPRHVLAARVRNWPTQVLRARSVVRFATSGDALGEIDEPVGALTGAASLKRAMTEAIAAVDGKGLALCIVLGDAFVTYFVLPYSKALQDERDWSRLAMMQASHLTGLNAAQLHVRVSPAGRGKPRLACAVRLALIENLRSAAAEHSNRILEITPAFMRVFNTTHSGRAAASAWILSFAGERLTFGITENARWLATGTAWARPEPHALISVLEQEAMLRGIAPPKRAVLPYCEWLGAQGSLTLPDGFTFVAARAQPRLAKVSANRHASVPAPVAPNAAAPDDLRIPART